MGLIPNVVLRNHLVILNASVAPQVSHKRFHAKCTRWQEILQMHLNSRRTSECGKRWTVSRTLNLQCSASF